MRNNKPWISCATCDSAHGRTPDQAGLPLLDERRSDEHLKES